MADLVKRGFMAGFLKPALSLLQSSLDASVWDFINDSSINIEDEGSYLLVTARIPGVRPDNLDVVVHRDGLTLKGEYRQTTQQGENGRQTFEWHYESFYRSFSFPVAVRHEEALVDCSNGLVRITVPKATVGSATLVRSTGSSLKRRR